MIKQKGEEIKEVDYELGSYLRKIGQTGMVLQTQRQKMVCKDFIIRDHLKFVY